MTMALGKIQVDLVANTGSFVKELRSAQSSIKIFGATVKTGFGVELASAQRMLKATAGAMTSLKTVIAGAAVALAAGKLIAALDNAADGVDKLGKVSKRLGLPVEQMSALQYVTEQSGLEFDKLAGLASKAGKEIAKLVSNGNTTAQVGRFNVALTTSGGQVRDIVSLMGDLSKGIQSVGSAAEQLRLSQRFFGRGGGDEFVTFLKESGTFTKAMADGWNRASQIGAIYTEDQVEKLTAYRDAVSDVQKAWNGLLVRMATDVAPQMRELLDDLTLRIAQVPAAFAGVRNAVKLSAGGNSAAGGAVDELMASAVKLLIVGASESAQVFTSIIVEGFRVAGVNASIALAQGLRDHLPERLYKALALDPNVGDDSELVRLRSAKMSLQRMQGFVEMGADAPFNVNGWQSQVDYWAKQIAGSQVSYEKALTTVDTLIAAQERMLAMNTGVNAKLQSMVITTSGANVSETLREAMASFRESLAAFDKAQSDIMAYSLQSGLVGPPAPGASRSPIAMLQDSFSAITVQAEDAGSRVWTAMAAGLRKSWSAVQTELKRSNEAAAQTLAAAQSVVEEIYPEERVKRTVKELQALRAEMEKLGKLTPQVAAAIDMKISNEVESLSTKADEVDDLAADMASSVRSFSYDAGQAFASFALKADVSLQDILASWTQTLLAMYAQKRLFDPIFNAIGGAISGPATTPISIPKLGMPSTGVQVANGGVFSSGKIQPFARGGVVGKPTLFPMANGGIGLMGEAGPEAIMPLQRIGGKLGVRSAGGGVVVNVYNHSSSTATTSERSGPDGQRIIDVMVRNSVRGMIGDGSLDKVLGSSFGLTRKGTSR
jgi:hypothetical protein